MPPKTNYTVPLGNVVEMITKSKRTKQGVRTTEIEVPFQSSKLKKSAQASGSKKRTVIHTEAVHTEAVGAQASRHPSHDTEETHPLQFIAAQEDDFQDFQTEDMPSQSDVCTTILPCLIMALIACRHQWING